MTDADQAPEPRWEPLLAPASLATVVFVTIVALTLPSSASPDLDAATRTTFFAVMVAAALVELLVNRFVVLPAIARGQGSRSALHLVANAFAVSPALYGLVAVILTGERLAALPLAGIAAVTWAANWLYLRDG